jgi:PAS domain S-box-containing protein
MQPERPPTPHGAVAPIQPAARAIQVVGALLVVAAALVALDWSQDTWRAWTAWLLASGAASVCTALTAARVQREDYRATWIYLSCACLLSAVTAGLALAGVTALSVHSAIAAIAVTLAIAAVACRYPSGGAFVAAAIEMAPVPVVLAAIPAAFVADAPSETQAWTVVLGLLYGTLAAVSARVVSLRGRERSEALGSLLFPLAMAMLGFAGLVAPRHVLEGSELTADWGHVAWLAGYVLLCGAAARRLFARARPPRFAAPPPNDLSMFAASTVAVLSIAIAALLAGEHGYEALAALFDAFALVAVGAYVARAFLLRSAVHRLLHRLERTTETLRKEQDFSSAVLDAAGSLINVLDRDGRLVRWNRACEEVAGRSSADLTAPGAWVDLLPPEEGALVSDRIERIINGELRNTGENHWIRPDGERRLISWTNSGLVDANGEVEFVVAVGVDVTDNRRAERELQRTTSTLRGLIDASPLPIVATDREDVVQVWSPAAERLTGWSPDDALGRTLADLTVPADREDEHAYARVGLLGGATVTGLETVRRRRNGSTVAVEVSASPLRAADGSIMGIVWVETDVTARRQAAEALRESEERFRGYFEHAPTGSVVSTPDGTIVGANPAFCRMLGYTEEELVGTSFASITHPEDLSTYLERRQALVRGEQPRLEHDKRYLHKDGHAVWVHLSIAKHGEGHDRRLFAHVQDVAERKRAELEREEMLELMRQMLAELEAQNDRLRELDRLKDEFLALVSHELRTPLTSIRGYLSVMSDKEFATSAPDQERFLEVVDRNARRLEQLVEDLLLIAQIDAGKLELQRFDVDLAGVAADAVETAAASARSRGVEVTLEQAGETRLSGDASRLGQVLDNLLANALKFTPDGGSVLVTVGSDGAEAYVEIEDTGIGIPGEEQAQLFQRFFRATNARQRAIKGTGLGLAICRAIVEAHRGRIDVRSEPGQGTTVTVRIPLDAPHEALDARAA